MDSEKDMSNTIGTDTLHCYDTMNGVSSGSITINTTGTTSNFGNTGGVSYSNGTGTSSLIWTDHITMGPTYGTMPLRVNGDAEIEGKLVVGGKNIADSLEKIEKRLAILHQNPELEARWDSLRELAEKYRELEKEILEKEQIYNILKK